MKVTSRCPGHEFVVHPGLGHGFLQTAPVAAADAWSRIGTLLLGGRTA